jgi:hypothetical protein
LLLLSRGAWWTLHLFLASIGRGGLLLGRRAFVQDHGATIHKRLKTFHHILQSVGLQDADGVILFRELTGLRDFLGGLDITGMNDAVKRLVRSMNDFASGKYSDAAKRAGEFLRVCCDDADLPVGEWSRLGWMYLRGALPPIGQEPVSQWISLLRDSVRQFAQNNNLVPAKTLPQKITIKGFPNGQADELLSLRPKPLIEVRTIHDVKGLRQV